MSITCARLVWRWREMLNASYVFALYRYWILENSRTSFSSYFNCHSSDYRIHIAANGRALQTTVDPIFATGRQRWARYWLKNTNRTIAWHSHCRCLLVHIASSASSNKYYLVFDCVHCLRGQCGCVLDVVAMSMGYGKIVNRNNVHRPETILSRCRMAPHLGRVSVQWTMLWSVGL